MRRLFQRRRAAACRRHTVANIPAPDGSVTAERRSSDDAAGPKSRDPRADEQYQYQYVPILAPLQVPVRASVVGGRCRPG